MEKEAYRALEDEFIAVAKPEDLRKEDREMCTGVLWAQAGSSKIMIGADFLS